MENISSAFGLVHVPLRNLIMVLYSFAQTSEMKEEHRAVPSDSPLLHRHRYTLAVLQTAFVHVLQNP